jgi:CRP-like cAMP-binding protein
MSRTSQNSNEFSAEQDLLYSFFTRIYKISREEFELSAPFWKRQQFRKNEFYNNYQSICKYLGFVLDGSFRAYYIDKETGEEQNILLYSKNQLVVSYKSFLTQSPCDYYTRCVTDADTICIHYDRLQQLYTKSHEWERLGRFMAEMAFTAAVSRTESFLLQTPEERYLSFIQQHPDASNTIPLYHISSYLGIAGPSLSRIRRRLSNK